MIDETMKKSWEEKGCCLFAEAGSLGSFTPSKAGKGEARPVLKHSGEKQRCLVGEWGGIFQFQVILVNKMSFIGRVFFTA